MKREIKRTVKIRRRWRRKGGT